MSRAAVLGLQRALIALNYSLPRYGADGYWGRETRSALNRYLEDRGEPPLSNGLRPPTALVQRVVLSYRCRLLRFPPVEILGCDVSGWNDPKYFDIGAFHAAGGRFVYVAFSEAEIAKSKRTAWQDLVRGFNDDRGYAPEDACFIHTGGYHFVNFKYSKAARRDDHALSQSDYFADRVLEGYDGRNGFRYGDLYPAVDFETNAWESRPAARWTRLFVENLERRMVGAGFPCAATMYGYGWALYRLRSLKEFFAARPLWVGASEDVAHRIWERTSIKQVVKRQPWNSGRKIDTDTARVSLEKLCCLPKPFGEVCVEVGG